MNNRRRKKLSTIAKKLTKLQKEISELSDKLNKCVEEEREYLENVPASFRETEKYLETDDDFDDLNQMGMDLEDHAFDLESISEHLKVIGKTKGQK
jgi:hypothetical protein